MIFVDNDSNDDDDDSVVVDDNYYDYDNDAEPNRYL